MDNKYYYINTRNRLDEVLQNHGSHKQFISLATVLDTHKDGIVIHLQGKGNWMWSWMPINAAINQGQKIIGWNEKPIVDKKEEDVVNHPNHYNEYSFEVIDVIDEVVPNFDSQISGHIQNAIKYIFRAPFKGNETEDLKKAVWYLQHAIDLKEKK